MLEQYNDILTVEELCEILMVGRNTVYELLGSGRIKAFRSGSRWKIPKEAVIQFIQKEAGL